MSLFSNLSAGSRRRLLFGLGGVVGTLFITLGVFASNGWLPKTDALTGRKTGWFGRELPKHATSAWNPFPPPSPTPQLSKEYIYAGSRLLAVEDANATAAPPADIAVWRPTNGYWIVMGQAGSQATTIQFGSPTDKPLIGDYDGDGKTDFSVFREGATAGAESVFYVWPSSPTSWWGYQWGKHGDKGFTGDFDGDGKSDYGVVRQVPGAREWWINKSSDGNYLYSQWGNDSDLTAVADYDGDGKADIAVYRPSDTIFYIIRSSDGQYVGRTIGQSGLDPKVVSSDFDGDGKADPAIYIPATATWHIHQSTTSTVVSTVWGNNGSSGCTGSCTDLVPVHNDYDLDGKTDLAVWTPATNAVWTIKRSSNGTTRTETFGTTGDVPVPAFYRR